MATFFNPANHQNWADLMEELFFSLENADVPRAIIAFQHLSIPMEGQNISRHTRRIRVEVLAMIRDDFGGYFKEATVD
jgi:hypothetical protein